MEVNKELLEKRKAELKKTLKAPGRDDGGKGFDKFVEVYALAEQAGSKFPEVIASQWALESGWGTKPSGKNNYFGVKARPGEDYTDVTTHENYDGKGNSKTSEKFINYDSPIDSILDRLNRKHWADAEKNSNTTEDYINYLTHISKYATDSNYDIKLKNMVAYRQTPQNNFGLSVVGEKNMPKGAEAARQRQEREKAFLEYIKTGVPYNQGAATRALELGAEAGFNGIGDNSYSPEMMDALANSGPNINPGQGTDINLEEPIQDSNIEEYNLNSRGNLNTFYGISEPTINPQDTEALASNQGNPDMNQAKYGGLQLTNRFQNGGLLNEFNEGGSHEENPLGGIPQGIGSNGNLNTVEEGETKFGNYVFSDTLKLSKEDINNLFLPKKLEGKTYAEASKYLNKFIEDDPGNTITRTTIKKQLDSLILGNEKAKSLYQDNNLDITNQNQMFLGGSEGTMGFDISDPNATFSPANSNNTNLNNTNLNVGAIGNSLSGVLSGVNQVESVLNQDDPDNVSVGKNALSMAATGAGIGSVIPGVGTAIGAGVGAVAGLITGAFGKRKAKKRKEREMERQSLVRANTLVDDFKLGGELNKYDGGGLLYGTGITYTGDPEDNFQGGYNLNDPILRNMWGLNNTSIGPENSPASKYTPTGIAPWEKEYPDPEIGARNQVIVDSNIDAPYSEANYDQYGNPTGTGHVFSKGVHPLQYTNVLGSYLNYRDARKLKPEVERLNRINTRINPYLIDEAALLANAQNAMNTSVNAITNASGGSGSAVRAGILASGLNYNRGLSEATLQAQNYNNSQRMNADQLNLQTNQFNIGQDNQERDINARNRAMVRNAKQEARAALFDSISGVGKELTYDRRIRALTGGYDNSTYNPEQRNMMLDYLKFLQK